MSDEHPARDLIASRLCEWLLPEPGGDSDKEDRGQVLVIAGSREIPGAAILAATAALRAGAGKLTIATAASVAPGLGLAVPEALVIGLPETEAGGLKEEGIKLIAGLAERTSAILMGPGLQDGAGSAAFFAAVLKTFGHVPMVLDALAMDAALAARPAPVQLVITPHAGEMAHLTGLDKQKIKDDPLAVARTLAARCGATVVLKGATTTIVSPSGSCWRHVSTNPGLATSGSGDVLAGILAGLAARGADIEQAACWAVAVHAHAGQALGDKTGRIGFLARDLLIEIPVILQQFSGQTY